ncbi:PAS fold-containing protein [Flexibacter flexilis DSM 6793]|uniref:PAS fold-containing protein n=1 Tax=Flexibacter flexilis DSM 6793 TaxID=927664 RepID=A0A1I1IER3_9BACT|nr:LuxR C-terminal-related transcriptional regulator [Flexibacter flexilis]SFC32193.1 PAS fold-containing protein [Flexibacter flexilis DSM 6793]
MAELNHLQKIFFQFLMEFKFQDENLDYTVLPKHIERLKVLSEIGNSGIHIFDLAKTQIAFYEPNFAKLLGYELKDSQNIDYQFFESKIHPEDNLKLGQNGISFLKIFNAFTQEDKLSHKVIHEYRMLNADNQYIRLVEQYQILELDKTGQIWLMMSVIDISPNQDENSPARSQFLNFKTGDFIPFEETQKPTLELTRREVEILKLVKQGLLSKHIADKLSISIHTVNTHRQRLLEKLGANNSFEAVEFAGKFGLID